jgi:hypothetical protein
VLSTEVFQRLGVCPKTLRLLSNKGVSRHVPTPDAVAEYNRLVGTEPVCALIQSTC